MAFMINISPNAGICNAPIRDPVRRSPPWSGRTPFALLIASLRVMIPSCREYAFADAGNLEHCSKYLNQTLVTFGFPASLDLFATDPVRFHSTRLSSPTCIISDFCLYVVSLFARFIWFEGHVGARSRSRGPVTVFILCFNRDSGTSSSGRPPTIKDKGEFVFFSCFYLISQWSVPFNT